MPLRAARLFDYLYRTNRALAIGFAESHDCRCDIPVGGDSHSMLWRRASHRTAARLSAATRSPVRVLLEPLEARRFLAVDLHGSAGVVLQSTGKPVELDYDAAGHAVLVRFLAGSTTLDTSFGAGGAVATGVDTTTDIALAPGDKIVLVGARTIARFNADGTPDTSFNGTGVVSVTGESITAVAVQGDGKIVVGAIAPAPTGAPAIVQRFNTDGTIDRSGFINPPGTSDNLVSDVLVEKSGAIAVVGENHNGASGDTPFVAQLTSALAPDGTAFSIPAGSGTYDAVTEAPDGGLIAVGRAFFSGPPPSAGIIARFLPNGQLSFNGQYTGPFAAQLSDVAVTGDNKIVAAGLVYTGGSGLHDTTNDVLLRYDLAGNLDAAFGNTGTPGVAFTGSTYNDGETGLAIASDNSLFVSGLGNRTQDNVGSQYKTFLFHLNTNGATVQTSTLASQPTLPAYFEAEDFDLGGEGVGYHDTDAANLGGQYRPSEGVDIESAGLGIYDVGWTHTGEWMQYTVHNPNGASFHFDARVANYGSGGAFHVEVDGVNVTGTLAIPDTGGFQNYVDVVKDGFFIAAGDHVVRIVIDGQSQYGFGGNFDSFQLTYSTSQPFGTGPAAIPGIVQLENYDTGGEGAAYHDTTAANEGGAYRSDAVDLEATTDPGGGYDVGWTHTGEYLKYTVNVTQSGSYIFQTRVADYGAGASFHWEVDGVNVTGPQSIPDTGGFQKWTTVYSQPINITAGQHVLRLVIDAQSQYGFGGNFDYLILSPEAPCGANDVPGTIEGENYDVGGEGIAYHDTTPQNQGGAYRNAEGVDIEALPGSGAAVDYTHTGEWMKYTVNVTTPGSYTLDARVANYGTGGAFHLEVDGVNVTGTLAVPDTRSFTTFTDVIKGGIALSAGQHVLRWVWDGESQYGFSGNLDWFKLA
jgi:uncharacterized delta-60 repeat protein